MLRIGSRSDAMSYAKPVDADDRGAGQGKRHRGRHDHHRDRGRRPDRVAQVLQDEREPEDARSTRRRARSTCSPSSTSSTRSTNPATEISLKEAQELYGEEAEVDMEIEFPKRTDVLGRIAAQTAKQVIFQKVREAERENVFAEYNERVGEVHQQHWSSASRTAT